jgi:GTP-binding protein
MSQSQFVDECQLNVRGGDGGAGCISFRREGPEAMGGPNGGDGGDGGDVWLVADHNVSSLLAFRDHPHRRAVSGVHGKGKDMHGRRGESLEIMVPMGTVVHDMYSGDILAELVNHGDRWLAAAGGRGGRGNAKFLSNKRRAPSFAEQGEHGEERWLRLELRLMADVALVGFPNAGKSTFISVISAAKPKIADYPFTTLEPNLGVVRVDDATEFVVADIPGLIEGASEGKGLGHRFLRHVERARVLCLLLDLVPSDGVSPQEQERILLHELGAYRPELLERPRVVVGTKADVVQHAELEALGWDGLVMSSVTRQGVSDVVGQLAQKVHDVRQAIEWEEGVVVLRPDASGAAVERVGDGEFRLLGRDVERIVALNDVTTPEALSYIDHRLDRLGVPKMLSKAGAKEGDVIWIGEFSFEYSPDL